MTTLPAVIAIRWAAASQALTVVAIHGIWMLFAAHTWTEAHPSERAPGVVVDRAMDFYRWLGGMGPDGRHGNIDTLLVAWFKLSLPFYLLAELWRWKRGPRPPARWWVLVLWSTGVALAGYSLALWPTLPALGGAQGIPWLLAMMTIGAALATAWAIVAHRLGERVIGLIECRRGVAIFEAPLAWLAPPRHPVTVPGNIQGTSSSPEFAAVAIMDRDTPSAQVQPVPKPAWAKWFFVTLAILVAMILAYVGSIVLLLVMALSG